MSREALLCCASEALDFFHVQIDSAEEQKELLEHILAEANPTGDIMGFNQLLFEDAVARLVEKQFAADNPVLALPTQSTAHSNSGRGKKKKK